MTAKKKLKIKKCNKKTTTTQIHKQLLTSKMHILDNYLQFRYRASIIIHNLKNIFFQFISALTK